MFSIAPRRALGDNPSRFCSLAILIVQGTPVDAKNARLSYALVSESMLRINKMQISIASDYAGFEYKCKIIEHLESAGHQVKGHGTDSNKSVDYPDFIKPAAVHVAQRLSTLGIVLGGSGNGEAIAANKIPGIRCAVCWNTESAELAKKHNNANMISLGQRMMTLETALGIVDIWLGSEFEGGRHIARIEKIEK